MLEYKEITGTDLNPELEIKVVDASEPKILSTFRGVLVNVPNVCNGTSGDKHFKLIPEHYLVIGDIVRWISDHYRRGDFPIPDKQMCAVTRHFFVKNNNFGKKIPADVQVLRNDNGSISLNIFETHRRRQGQEVIEETVTDVQYKMSMRPKKEGETESPTLFLVPETDKCIEFIPIFRRLEN